MDKAERIYRAERFWLQLDQEEAERTCIMTECLFNEASDCRSPSSTFNPDLLDYCPDYTDE